MKSILPQPKMLPIRLNVMVGQTEIKGTLQVKPYETLDTLISKLKELQEQK
jgi:hypothetical protein